MYMPLLLLLLSSSLSATSATYEKAGVHIDVGDALVDAIAPLARATARAGTHATLGDFGGFFDLKKTEYKDPILVSTTDGVGTKLKIAHQVNVHDSIGTDLVAMNVNDLIVHGAEPVFFLDYFATGRLQLDQARAVISGIAHACKECNCALIGGETAEMPGMYQSGEYDLAGFSVGLVERLHILPRKELIKPGDLVIGIASSGLHSNGYSLVRHIIAERNIDITAKPPFTSSYNHLYDELLKPTKLYITCLLPLIKQQKIKALAHITGGGLYENIPRVLPDHCCVHLDMSTWAIPPVFSWLAHVGPVSPDHMLRTFNCGIGMVAIVDAQQAPSILNHLRKVHENAWVIGSVCTRDTQDAKHVVINNQQELTMTHEPLQVLVVGGGAREHALVHKIVQSPYVTQVFVAPGNGGTNCMEKVQNVDIAANNVSGLLEFAQSLHIDLTIVGPEAPLAAGITDAFTKAGLACLGPTQAAAHIETSKCFAKEFMMRHQIPTAAYAIVTTMEQAQAYINSHPAPFVIKADGLAQGKGVIITDNKQEAIEETERMLSGAAFGNAGKQVVIEQFITGQEVSFIVLTDGTHAIPLATAQDYKKRNDGDLGPNTGGLGSYSPAPCVTPTLHDRIMRTIIEPTIAAMRREGTPFVGFLYAGLMITPAGDPYVLEFNCRLGDPETQAIISRMQTDLVALARAAVTKNLSPMTIQWDARKAVNVVIADSGYPYDNNLAQEITINNPSATIYHGATMWLHDRLVTTGGRILSVTALADTFAQARAQAYEGIAAISLPKKHYRTDVAACVCN